jgi:omega-hydroxy-beta-dihydromenaquinone-9 sulfotransferase
MDAFQAARAAVASGQWLEVRHEDVLGDPRGQVTAMLEFLGLRWTPEFEAGFYRYAFETGRREAYRRDLEPDQLALLERSLAGHLQAHRYPTLVGPTQKAGDPDAARRFNVQSRGPDGRTHQ